MICYGRFLKERFHIEHEYFPFLVAGFEYGMLGVGLFGSAYSLEKIGYLAIMDLGMSFLSGLFLCPCFYQKEMERRISSN